MSRTTDTNREVVVDNSDADQCRKCRMSTRGDGDTWTNKKTKVSVLTRMIDSDDSLTFIFLYRGDWTSISKFMLGEKGQR